MGVKPAIVWEYSYVYIVHIVRVQYVATTCLFDK
jgi:hypothetical protein